MVESLLIFLFDLLCIYIYVCKNHMWHKWGVGLHNKTGQFCCRIRLLFWLNLPHLLKLWGFPYFLPPLSLSLFLYFYMHALPMSLPLSLACSCVYHMHSNLDLCSYQNYCCLQ